MSGALSRNSGWADRRSCPSYIWYAWCGGICHALKSALCGCFAKITRGDSYTTCNRTTNSATGGCNAHLCYRRWFSFDCILCNYTAATHNCIGDTLNAYRSTNAYRPPRHSPNNYAANSSADCTSSCRDANFNLVNWLIWIHSFLNRVINAPPMPPPTIIGTSGANHATRPSGSVNLYGLLLAYQYRLNAPTGLL